MGKAATVITATLVAVFFSGLANAGRIYVPQKSAASSVASASTSSRVGDVLRSGAIEGTYIPGYNQDRQIPVKVLNSNDFSVRRTFEAAGDILKNNRANAAAVAASAAVSAAVAAVGWVIDEAGKPVKKIDGSPVVGPSPTDIYWEFEGDKAKYASAPQACASRMSSFAQYYPDIKNPHPSYQSATQATCLADGFPGKNDTNSVFGTTYRVGSTCPSNSSYSSAAGGCVGSGTEPLTPSDWDQLQTALNQQSSAPNADPNFIKDLIRASCEGSLAPQRCYDSLMANGPGSASQNLSGPSTITTPGNTSVTVSKDKDGNISSTTTNSTTTFNITYGNNYYNYSSTTTKTKTNPDGSTETTTDEESEDSGEKYPEQPDPLSPVIKEYDKVSEAVKTPHQTVDGLTPKPWFSFGGSCQEIDFNSPIGRIKTDYCPTIESYVKPVLAFIFAISAYLYCMAIWRETTMNVRPT